MQEPSLSSRHHHFTTVSHRRDIHPCLLTISVRRMSISDTYWMPGSPSQNTQPQQSLMATPDADFPFTVRVASGLRAENFHLLSGASFTQDLWTGPADLSSAWIPAKRRRNPSGLCHPDLSETWKTIYFTSFLQKAFLSLPPVTLWCFLHSDFWSDLIPLFIF